MNAQLLVGPRVRLTAMSEADLPTVGSWWSNSEFARLASDDPAVPQTLDELRKWFLPDERWKLTLGIRLSGTDDLIGFLKVDVTSWPHRTGDISLGIGEPRHWDHGYGTEAMRLGIDFAFRELNLHRLQLGVFNHNHRAIHTYRKLGFTAEGQLRESLRRDGQWHDTLLFGLLAHEWLPPTPAAEPAGEAP